ncbi:MAG: DUF2961 domain-containing protein [Planctomycetota bacterium]|jgi:hypothetical protein
MRHVTTALALMVFAGLGLLCSCTVVYTDPGRLPNVALMSADARTGFSNGGWKYDRYQSAESLDAHKRMTVADLKGPGIITNIHTTRHKTKGLFARGIVLEIYFDGAKEPAVMSPLADFFGDGCNGNSTLFSSQLIECAPWSYNCYFPMPFRKSAKVVLRNDTDRSTMNYSYVEWESLPEWNPSLGYFHATYQRKTFQLTKETDETFFEINGSGHILGRQFSVVTKEPIFKEFHYVMEGNNEVDIDGTERAIDYLGTEDSFTFSWGFREPFAGLRAGMPLIRKEKTHLLSLYRFHNHMPIRFKRHLRWNINWKHEKIFTSRPEWPKTVSGGGCWVDYATVYYWYQDRPAGYRHADLRPLEDRSKPMLPR